SLSRFSGIPMFIVKIGQIYIRPRRGRTFLNGRLYYKHGFPWRCGYTVAQRRGYCCYRRVVAYAITDSDSFDKAACFFSQLKPYSLSVPSPVADGQGKGRGKCGGKGLGIIVRAFRKVRTFIPAFKAFSLRVLGLCKRPP